MGSNKRIVCGCFGTIYYARVLKNNLMSTDRVEVTDDAIQAVFDHLMMQDTMREEKWAGYDFDLSDKREMRLCVYDRNKYKLVKINESEENK